MNKNLFTLPCWLDQVPDLSTSTVPLCSLMQGTEMPESDPSGWPGKDAGGNLKDRTSQEHRPSHTARACRDWKTAQDMEGSSTALQTGFSRCFFRSFLILCPYWQPHSALASIIPAFTMNSHTLWPGGPTPRRFCVSSLCLCGFSLGLS